MLSVVIGKLEKEEVYRAKIFDSLRSLCFVIEQKTFTRLLEEKLFLIRIIIRKKITQIIINMLNYFFIMYLHFLKTLADNNSHLFWEQNPGRRLLNKFIYLFIVKICNFITMRFYLCFQNIFNVDWITIKSFF